MTHLDGVHPHPGRTSGTGPESPWFMENVTGTCRGGEMVNTVDSKSTAERLTGSIPVLGTV